MPWTISSTPTPGRDRITVSSAAMIVSPPSERKTLLATTFGVQKFFEKLRLVDAAKDAHLLGLVNFGCRRVDSILSWSQRRQS